ncbi:CIC11C00000000873 [Sungouiella intermedia]|nr:CIC11C00000000873 [[Candida] intermedia]
MTLNELVIYVKLINKALFILNRKYFKNEKYKRMLSLTNLTWEYILKKYNVIKLLNLTNDKKNGRIEFFDYQVSGFMNMSELFNVMDVPQPALISNGVNVGRIQSDDVLMRDLPQKWDADDSDEDSPSNKQLNQSMFSNQLIQQNLDKRNDSELHGQKLELMQLNEKIYYDLRNNFVDINDYCTFYSSLENVLHELMDYVNTGNEILL